MYPGFIHWYAVVAPLWLVSLFLNMQRALMQYFSVSLMVRTLFSHWRKDAVSYQGYISSRLIAFAWNQISRGVGFIIRTLVLTLWAVTSVIFLVLGCLSLILFLSWPALIVVGFFTSLAMLIQ